MEVLRRHILVVHVVHLAVYPTHLTCLRLAKSVVNGVVPAHINLNLICVFGGNRLSQELVLVRGKVIAVSLDSDAWTAMVGISILVKIFVLVGVQQVVL